MFFGQLAGSLLDLAPPLTGCRILDVGCGCGASLEVLASAAGVGGAVVGFDLSLGMLREAKRRLGESARIFSADACGFANSLRWAFDAVVYNAVLFMLPDPIASLRSAWSVLAPGGVLLIASLDGLFVGDGEEPIGDVLAGRGHAPGRHAIATAAMVNEIVDRYFVSRVSRGKAFQLGAGEFFAFYGLEPMSAGLLPRLTYPERKAVLHELAKEWGAAKITLSQMWTLTAARKPKAGDRAQSGPESV